MNKKTKSKESDVLSIQQMKYKPQRIIFQNTLKFLGIFLLLGPGVHFFLFAYIFKDLKTTPPFFVDSLLYGDPIWAAFFGATAVPIAVLSVGPDITNYLVRLVLSYKKILIFDIYTQYDTGILTKELVRCSEIFRNRLEGKVNCEAYTDIIESSVDTHFDRLLCALAFRIGLEQSSPLKFTTHWVNGYAFWLTILFLIDVWKFRDFNYGFERFPGVHMWVYLVLFFVSLAICFQLIYVNDLIEKAWKHYEKFKIPYDEFV
ncbi:MAG: hypothetical protein QW051_04780 [Candidatus Aenigmatarchaeota archaeon]